MRRGLGTATQEEEYQFAAPTEVVWEAVQRGAAQTGWAVSASGQGSLEMKIPAQGTCNPATLTAQVYPAGPCTEVRLTASCFGVTLVMNDPLLGYVRTLLNLIDAQIHAQRSQPTASPRAVSDVTDRPADALALANHQKHPEDMDARALLQAAGAAMRAFQQVYEKTRTNGQAAMSEGRSGESGKWPRLFE